MAKPVEILRQMIESSSVLGEIVYHRSSAPWRSWEARSFTQVPADDLEEWIDVIILGIDGAWRSDRRLFHRHAQDRREEP